jgi:predicted mannosyl-3-phosphoglycerate phosphatase (HAD superfamily)
MGVANKRGVNVTKDERISNEISKLWKLFENIDKNKKDLVHDVISNASFIIITLQDLQKQINEQGVVIEYQNGANQWGQKQSPQIEVYNKLMANYLKIMKQLVELIPESKIQESDELMAFLKK